MSERIAVIMAGGSGERFWPLSTGKRPKQLLKLTSPNESMLEEAVNRIAPLVGRENVVLAIGSAIQDSVKEAAIVPDACVWAEPCKRNTLGCLTWVCANLLAKGHQEATVAVLTADHQIGSPDRFRETVAAALELAELHGGIVTIGIPPTRAETGYGYIEVDPETTVETAQGRMGYRSKSFREKPSQSTAEKFLKSGSFVWNSGMFFFRVSVFMRELKRQQPKAHDAVLAMAEFLAAGKVGDAATLFEDIPSISVDFAVMEGAEEVYVIPSDFSWDDMGAWDSLERSFAQDPLGNVIQGQAVLIDSRGCIVYNELSNVPIGLLGVRDFIVVAAEEGILVCPKDLTQRVKELAVEMRKS